MPAAAEKPTKCQSMIEQLCEDDSQRDLTLLVVRECTVCYQGVVSVLDGLKRPGSLVTGSYTRPSVLWYRTPNYHLRARLELTAA